MTGTSSYQRSSAYYRALGYNVVKVETHNRGHRSDYMGILDMHVLGVGELIGVQCCGKDWQEHVRKLTGSHRAQTMKWLLTGCPLILMGWRKIKGRWTPRIREITLEDLA